MGENARLLVDGKYSFQDLVDIDRLRGMFERFSQATGFTTGLVSFPDQELLIGTGWREICTKFHRAFPVSEVHCKQSNKELTSRLKELKELNVRTCASGLVDGATPIIVEGVHIANLFTGQILFEEPDSKRFRKQGEACGYDVEAYLKALTEVPVVTPEEFRKALEFLSEMAVLLAEQGLAELRNRQMTARIKESEQNLRITLNSIADAVISTDTQGRVVGMNPVAENLTGFATPQALGRPLTEIIYLIDGRTGEPAIDPVRQVLETGRTVGLASHLALIASDGTEYQIADSASPIRDSDGAMTGVVLVFRDQTEEYAMRQRLRKMAFLVESAASPIVMADLGGRLNHVNAAFLKAWGYQHEDQVLGRHITEFWNIADRMEGILQALREAGETSDEAEAIRRDGSVFTVEVSASMVRDDRGQPVAMMSTSLDITERRQAEEELRESEFFLQKTQKVARLGGWKLNPEIDFLAWTEGVYDIIEVPRDNKPGFQEGLKYFVEECVQDLKDRIQRCYDHGDPFVLECELITETGKRLWTEVRGVARVVEGKTAYVYGTFQDISERRRDEEERLSLERQVQHAQKLESLGVLAGCIAHDFNNILMSILGYASLTQAKLKPHSPVGENILKIERASRRAADLAQQMLAYSGKGRFVIEPIDLAEFVEEMAHLLEVSISKKVWLEYNFADSPTFDGDATQIRQVIMNLITNASEAIGSESGVISLSTGAMDCGISHSLDNRVTEPLPAGKYVYLEVTDTGCGMSAETIGKVFDPFFTTKVAGRGLGMSAVLGIVRGHKGAIQIDSEIGKGTTFRVRFPANFQREQDRGLTQVKRGTGEDLPVPDFSGTILIADDEESVCVVCKDMLEDLGFSVLTAPDGRAALKVFREHANEIICVLLDYTMPHMDGEETFRELRLISPDIKIILCSGYNLRKDVTPGFAEGGWSGFLQKPYSITELKEKLLAVSS